jgi:hypothetical protein
MTACGAKPQGGSVLLRVRFLRTSGLIGESMNEDSSGGGLIAWTSLKFSNRLGRGDSSERMEVRACRCLLAIADKIVRADIDQDDFPPAPLPVRDLLRLQRKPFFIRVGWVVADHAPQNFVVRRANARKVGRRHVGFSDTESTREMIAVECGDIVAEARATLAIEHPATALAVPDFHRLEHASFAWHTVSPIMSITRS